MMICNNCGSSLLDTAKFCPGCGSPNVDGSNDHNSYGLFNSAPPQPTNPLGYTQGQAPALACIVHPTAIAAGACVGCGNFYCRGCLYLHQARNYCHNCWARLGPTQSQPAPVYPQQNYNSNLYNRPAQYSVVPPKSPGLAMFLSFIMPGAGQLYNGDVGKGIAFFLAFFVLVWIFVGWIFWVVAMVDAYKSAQNFNIRLQA
jgi:TM2 domain-containing membrane protein YozV